MTAVAETPASARPRRRSAGGWRWTGRIFLVVMLIYTVMPLAWRFSFSGTARIAHVS